MTAERAIHEQWALYRPLVSLVPLNRVYTGKPPIRDDAEQTVGYPFVSLVVEGEAAVVRTTDNLLTTESLRLTVFTPDYDAARKISETIRDYFNRRDFSFSGGRVLDMKPINRIEDQDPDDGVWMVARDFQVQVAEPLGVKS